MYGDGVLVGVSVFSSDIYWALIGSVIGIALLLTKVKKKRPVPFLDHLCGLLIVFFFKNKYILVLVFILREGGELYFELINYTLKWVWEVMDEVLPQYPDICKCERCRHDIAAFAATGLLLLCGE